MPRQSKKTWCFCATIALHQELVLIGEMGAMFTRQTIMESLKSLLPSETPTTFEALSEILIGISEKSMSVEELQKRISGSSSLYSVLTTLSGQSMPIGGKVVDFGSSQPGDISIHDVAGGNIYKPTIGSIVLGVSYSDARQIAQDIFDLNFYRLSGVAHDVAKQRASEMGDKFLSSLFQRDPSRLASAADPDMQFVLFNAQKEYARSGDRDLEEVLVDILVERAGVMERNLRQLVLNEALEVAPKLPAYLYDTLSLIFMMRYARNNNLKSIDAFVEYIKLLVDAFKSGSREEDVAYQHLEYAGCCSIQISEVSIETIIHTYYKGLFWRSISAEEVLELQSRGWFFPGLIIQSLHQPGRFQFAIMDDLMLRHLADRNGVSANKVEELVNFHNSRIMLMNEIGVILENKMPDINKFFAIWQKTAMKNANLTSVGIAIAHANVRRKTKMDLDLGMWIS